MRTFVKMLPRALAVLAVATLALGVAYPAVVTLVGQVCFPYQANGSVIEKDGQEVGSALLGQDFTDAGHLWGRPETSSDTSSYTDASGNAVAYGSPSNVSPASESYGQTVSERVAAVRAADPARGDDAVPVDLVTESGSGLDPDISPAAAEYQVPRIASATGLSEDAVRQIISQNTQGRLLGVLGEERVNVLGVNLAIDSALGR
jgi:K+-transporting ATPase ATPase C chain